MSIEDEIDELAQMLTDHSKFIKEEMVHWQMEHQNWIRLAKANFKFDWYDGYLHVVRSKIEFNGKPVYSLSYQQLTNDGNESRSDMRFSEWTPEMCYKLQRSLDLIVLHIKKSIELRLEQLEEEMRQ